jgi:hypothetical protein
MTMKKTIPVAPIYTCDMEKTDSVVTVSLKDPGGRVVAAGRGNSVAAAQQNAAETTTDQGARLTLNQTVLPEL